MTLPQGLSVNPSSANGLGACSRKPRSRSGSSAEQLPGLIKLGTVQIDTPVLENPVPGEIYLAEQNNNPFNSLIALYIAAKLPNGQEVKLAGRADADPQHGSADDDLQAEPPAALRRPARQPLRRSDGLLADADLLRHLHHQCRPGPLGQPRPATAERSSSFQITQGAGGGACVSSDNQAPNTPSFTAGTVDPTAGAFTPFVLKLARQDGTQPIKGLELDPAPGPDRQARRHPVLPRGSTWLLRPPRAAKPSRPLPLVLAASQVGEVNVGAGAGPAPLNVGGKAYLAGPYKGAPLSMAIITPAVAGPFDLGTVVVRAALQVDPTTAQIKAVSDPIPTILQGIPLDVRTISVNLAKPSSP